MGLKLTFFCALIGDAFLLLGYKLTRGSNMSLLVLLLKLLLYIAINSCRITIVKHEAYQYMELA